MTLTKKELEMILAATVQIVKSSKPALAKKRKYVTKDKKIAAALKLLHESGYRY